MNDAERFFEYKKTSDRIPDLVSGTKNSGAVDLYSRDRLVCLPPREPQLIRTGVSIHLKDPAVAGLIMIRSSISLKGICLANGVGLIDSDYQGEILLNLINHESEEQEIPRNTKIAQLLIVQIVPPARSVFHVVDEFTTPTERGVGGFGSTN